MLDIFRYRIITNLQCNNRCSFCYQTFKPAIGSDIVLSIDKMESTMEKVFKKNGKLKRATIMGGESLLIENISKYIEITKKYAETVCLVTNGRLITLDLLKSMVLAGLDEIAISIYSLKNFKEMLSILNVTNMVIPNMRVNIPRCDESSYDKLKKLVEMCLDNNFGCVVCEDLMGRFGEPHDKVISKWENIKEVSNEHNFILYKNLERNKNFGLFAHYIGYNNTDIIITPLGNYCSWEKYCNKIENYDLH